MALPPDRGGSGWLRATRGTQVAEVLAGGDEPLDAADLSHVRATLRSGLGGAALAAAALAVLLFAGVALGRRLALTVGVGCALAFLAGYTAQIRAITRCYRRLPRGLPPVAVAAASLPAGVALGVLSALAVAAPYGGTLTLLLLGVGVGATALVTGVALGEGCRRAAVRQTRRPSGGRAGGDGRSTPTD